MVETLEVVESCEAMTHLVKLKPSNELARLELQRLDEQGRLFPEEVLDVARDDTSSLHEYFEWNNEKAGEAFRLMQASALIRQVKIEVVQTSRDTEPVRVRLEAEPVRERYFKPEPRTIDFDAIKREAIARLDELRYRYGHLEALHPVWEALEICKGSKSLTGDTKAQVMELFIKHPHKEWRVTEVAKSAGITEQKAMWYCNKLADDGNLKRKARGIYMFQRRI